MIENASFLWSCDGRTSTIEHRLEDHSVMAEFLAQADPLKRKKMFLEWRWCTLYYGCSFTRETPRKRSKIEISRRSWRWFRDLERKNESNHLVRKARKKFYLPRDVVGGDEISRVNVAWWFIWLLARREEELNSIIFNVKIILIRFSPSLPPIFGKKRSTYLTVTSHGRIGSVKKPRIKIRTINSVSLMGIVSSLFFSTSVPCWRSRDISMLRVSLFEKRKTEFRLNIYLCGKVRVKMASV